MSNFVFFKVMPATFNEKVHKQHVFSFLSNRKKENVKVRCCLILPMIVSNEMQYVIEYFSFKKKTDVYKKKTTKKDKQKFY